eukprot:SAG31_NODE_1612_length_7743_cov_6.653323_4_plen_103_part_00
MGPSNDASNTVKKAGLINIGRQQKPSCPCRLDQHLADETTYLNKEYRLPDGQKIGDSSRITLRRERYQAAECLFRPSLVGVDDADVSSHPQQMTIVSRHGPA